MLISVLISLLACIATAMGAAQDFNPCISHLLMCTKLSYPMTDSVANFNLFFLSEKEFNRRCWKQSAFIHCINEAVSSSCSGDTENEFIQRLLHTRLTPSKLCTQEGGLKQKYLDSAACVNDATLNLLHGACFSLITATPSMKQKCQIQEELLSCASQLILELCGAEASAIYKQVVQLGSINDDFSCARAKEQLDARLGAWDIFQLTTITLQAYIRHVRKVLWPVLAGLIEQSREIHEDIKDDDDDEGAQVVSKEEWDHLVERRRILFEDKLIIQSPKRKKFEEMERMVIDGDAEDLSPDEVITRWLRESKGKPEIANHPTAAKARRDAALQSRSAADDEQEHKDGDSQWMDVPYEFSPSPVEDQDGDKSFYRAIDKLDPPIVAESSVTEGVSEDEREDEASDDHKKHQEL